MWFFLLLSFLCDRMFVFLVMTATMPECGMCTLSIMVWERLKTIFSDSNVFSYLNIITIYSFFRTGKYTNKFQNKNNISPLFRELLCYEFARAFKKRCIQCLGVFETHNFPISSFCRNISKVPNSTKKKSLCNKMRHQ